MRYSFRTFLLACMILSVVSGCKRQDALLGSWASPVKDMHLTDVKQAYAVFTFRHDGKLELLQYGSVIPTILGDYANHMLIMKSLGGYRVSGTTLVLSGVWGDSEPHTWIFSISGDQLIRSEGGSSLAPLTRVPFVSRYGVKE